MTEDFKSKMLNWVTSNYEVESGDNVPIFNQQQTIFNNFINDIYSIGENVEIKGIFQLTNGKGELLNNNVVYGNYTLTLQDTNYKGFISIADDKFNVIQTIKIYYGGTELPPFKTLEIENGTVYGIYNTATKSNLLMFSINKDIENLGLFKVIFKKSYEISDDYDYQKIIKKSNEGEYIVSGLNNSYYIVVCNIKINVGSDNEINIYSGNQIINKVFDIYSNFDNNFKIAAINSVKYFEYYLNNGTLTYYNFENTNFTQNIMSTKILNETYTYIMNLVLDGSNIPQILNIYKLNKTNSTYTIIHQKISFNFVNSLNYDVDGFFKTIEGELFFQYCYNTANITYPELKYSEIIVGRIVNDIAYFEIIYLEKLSNDIMGFSLITKSYNLYKYNIISETTLIPILQIYNSQNYNGLEYQALNSMIPNSTILYDENGEIVYAKNLYNKTINNNTTTSTVDIPNNFLNDVTVHTSELYGETNSKLILSTKEITKNIYESVLLNFVNTIVIKDINTVVPKIMSVASSDLNNSISNLIDYDNSRLSKYKINYSDDTFRITPINLNAITYNSNSATYIISVYVPTDKSIKNIELISNDENISYLSIDCTSLENNKFYNITQKLEVE